MKKPKSKTVKESSMSEHYQIFPNDLNPRGIIFGGVILEEIDKKASLVAQCHSERICLTKEIDSISFLEPAKLGETLIFKTAVNRAWGTSMEIGVKVLAKNFQTGNLRHICSAYAVFVAVNTNNRPVEVLKVIPKSKEEKRRYKEAGVRRKHRLSK